VGLEEGPVGLVDREGREVGWLLGM
jgi:hypothetical protein